MDADSMPWTGALQRLLGIKWYQFISNAEVQRTSGHLSLLQLSKHIALIDDNADARKILTASPPEDWKRPHGRPRITWMKTVLNDLEFHNLTLTEAVDMAQNRPLWRL